MIPNTKDRALETSGVTATGSFGISLKDSVHIMTILRDTLYSDKVLAVLREYSANAWDAHREVNKSDLPIKVTIPTSLSPVLTIRDFGPGLSQDDVFQVYTQYGASTKRGSDRSVGMLGIGSKSGFAYSDSFTVTSWHGGKKRVFVAVLDKTEEGVINQLHEEDCAPDETGIEIQIAIRPTDVLEFHAKAKRLFQYFEPRPDINIDLPEPPTVKAKLQHGTMIESREGEDGSHQWVAVMGCVPYRIDLQQIRAQNNNGVGIAEYITQISGALYFNIGDVQISASREELKYSDMTKKALIEKFSTLVDEFVQHTLDNIDKGGFTFWERRIKAQILTALHLPIPKSCKAIVQDHVKLKRQPKTAILTQYGTAVSGINIASHSRLILKDDDRNMAGFHLGAGDYLITKNDGATWAEVDTDLNDMLAKSSLDGMPIVKLSTLSWYMAPKRGSNRLANPKHKVACFKMAKEEGFYSPYSEIWEPVDRVPTKDDVYVILSKFKGYGYNFFQMYAEDRKLAKRFGGTMPAVYGYKTTEKRPVTTATGTSYSEWRKEFLKSLLTKKVAKLFNYWEWSRAADNSSGHSPSKKHYETLRDRLGARHPIVMLFKRQQIGKRITAKFDRYAHMDYQNFKERLFRDEKDRKSEAEIAMEDVLKKYPLLDRFGLGSLWGSYGKEWAEYVDLVDNQ